MQDLLSVLREDVIEGAKALLGAELVCGGMRARIVETEAYRAEDDPGCHAFGKTAMKNMVLFGEPGRAYVYLNYGIHWMLNVSAHENGRAAGVLVRAAEPLEGLDEMRSRRGVVKDTQLLSGPGKLCQAFGIDQRHNGCELVGSVGRDLHILPGPRVTRIAVGPRIGLSVGKGEQLPWRFVDAAGMRWASRPHPTAVYEI